MAGIQLNFTNIAKFISLTGQFLLIFFLVMLSIFNQDYKGLFYVFGIMIFIGFNILLTNLYKDGTNIKRLPYYCNLFEISNLSQYSYPSQSSMIISFTLIYLLLPMIFNNQMNFSVLSTLITMLVIDTYSKNDMECNNYNNSLAGIFFGLMFGAIWYFIILYTLGKRFLYFNVLGSNNVVCNRPSKQTFKCSVYKNGKLITSNIT